MPPFKSTWWSITPPPGWLAQQDEECASFARPDGVGALQISAARKDDASVTVDDLREFAASQIPSDTVLSHVHFEAFDGLHAAFSKQGSHWEMWWLRTGSLMVCVTHNCPVDDAGIDTDAVHRSLDTLEPTGGAA